MVELLLLPLLQSICTCLFAMATSAALALFFSVDPLPWSLAVGSLSGLASWLILAARARRGAELLKGLDLEAQQGQPGTKESTTVLLAAGDLHEGTFLDLPCTHPQLESLARIAMIEGGLTVSRLTGPGGPFSRSEWEQLRGVMLGRGLLRQRHPTRVNLGVEPTKKGMALMRFYASPTLPDDKNQINPANRQG